MKLNTNNPDFFFTLTRSHILALISFEWVEVKMTDMFLILNLINRVPTQILNIYTSFLPHWFLCVDNIISTSMLLHNFLHVSVYQIINILINTVGQCFSNFSGVRPPPCVRCILSWPPKKFYDIKHYKT